MLYAIVYWTLALSPSCLLLFDELTGRLSVAAYIKRKREPKATHTCSKKRVHWPNTITVEYCCCPLFSFISNKWKSHFADSHNHSINSTTLIAIQVHQHSEFLIWTFFNWVFFCFLERKIYQKLEIQRKMEKYRIKIGKNAEMGINEKIISKNQFNGVYRVSTQNEFFDICQSKIRCKIDSLM